MSLSRCLFCLTLICSMAVNAEDAPPRNVVLFITDDQGQADAGCYGHPVVKTPGLDALAAEGTRFTNAFCTTASCSSSRSVILSGLHTHTNGMYGLAHADHHFQSFDKIKGLPARLSEAGYRTICIGKKHVAPATVYPFDVELPVQRPRQMAEAAREHIASDDPRPFFLLFGTVEPHRPFHHQDFPAPSPNDVIVPPWLPDLPEVREELARYYASIQQADSGLAALIDILKETGQWENTLVIAISDNGAPFPGAKTNLYEPGAKLPCVVRNPLHPTPGAVCDALVSWCDITPTVLDYAGLYKRPREFAGRSLLPILSESSPPGWDHVFMSHQLHEITMYYPMRVLRERRFKLIWNIAHELPFPFASDLYESSTWQAVLNNDVKRYGQRDTHALLHRPEFELYDLETDPHEVVNLASDPAHAQTLARMQSQIREWQKQTKDSWELKWERE